MDLQTVKNNIINDAYKTFDEVFAGIQLIWTNCKLFNQQGSPIYIQAEKMERKSKKLIKNLMSNIFGGIGSSFNTSKTRANIKLPTPELSISGQISQNDHLLENRKIFQIEYDDPKSSPNMESKLLGKRSFKSGPRDVGDSDDGQLQLGGEAGDCLMSMRDVSYSSNDMD